MEEKNFLNSNSPIIAVEIGTRRESKGNLMEVVEKINKTKLSSSCNRSKRRININEDRY